MNRQLKQIKICTFNANCIHNQKGEITQFLKNEQIDILLAQETFLKSIHKFKIPNYIVHRTDRTTGRGGGTAILIRKSIKHTRLQETPNNTFEYTAIQLENTKITIISCYKKPQDKIHIEDVENLLQLGQKVIIGGDLNAKHTTWNSYTTNPAGTTLYNHIKRRLDIQIHSPSQPTRRMRDQEDILDIFIHKNIKTHNNCTVITALNSDHMPVVQIVHETQTIHLPTPPVTYNWNKLTQSIEATMTHIKTPETHQEIEEEIEKWTQHIQNAMEKAKQQQEIKNIEHNLPPDIINKIKTKNAYRKLYQNTRYPPYKTIVNTLQNEIKIDIQKDIQTKWKNYINKIYSKHDGNKIYKIPKMLKKNRTQIPTLNTTNGTANTDTEKANAIADTLEKQFTPLPIKNSIIRFIIEHNNTTLETLNTAEKIKIEQQQVEHIIKHIPVNKAPGTDNITNKVLRTLPPIAISNLTKITQAIFNTNHYPDYLKTAKIIPILKPRKSPHDPKNYRPISLLNGTAKIIEKLIHNNIQEHMEHNKLYNENQHGFRKGKSTTTQLRRLIDTIHEAKLKKKATVIACLDLEKAFDKTNHNIIISKMLEHNIHPNIIKLTKSYLTHRKYYVETNGSTSSIRHIKSGIPQGSCLGPLLFTIFINDIPPPKTPYTSQFLYADDTALLTSHIRPTHAINTLKKETERAINYFENFGMKINIEKTQSIIINRKNKTYKTKLKIKNHTQNWNKHITYLGIKIDQKQNYIQHIRAIRGRAWSTFNTLKPLIQYLPHIEATKIYKIYIRPIMEYGLIATHTSKHIHKLDQTQNRILRTIYGSHSRDTNATIRGILGIESFEDRRRQTMAKLLT